MVYSKFAWDNYSTVCRPTLMLAANKDYSRLIVIVLLPFLSSD